MSIGNHFAAVIGWADFHRSQLNGNFCERRGDLFYPMREKFHYQAQPGEGASQFDRNGAPIWRMTFLFGFPQARRTAPEFRQLFELGRVLFDSPNEVVPATAQDLEWFDPVLLAEAADCLFNRLLNGKHAFWIDKRFRRIIEVDVFDIEVRNQPVAVPKRTADFEAIIQKRIQRSR